jgi:hypothetical protein
MTSLSGIDSRTEMSIFFLCSYLDVRQMMALRYNQFAWKSLSDFMGTYISQDCWCNSRTFSTLQSRTAQDPPSFVLGRSVKTLTGCWLHVCLIIAVVWLVGSLVVFQYVGSVVVRSVIFGCSVYWFSGCSFLSAGFLFVGHLVLCFVVLLCTG